MYILSCVVCYLKSAAAGDNSVRKGEAALRAVSVMGIRIIVHCLPDSRQVTSRGCYCVSSLPLGTATLTVLLNDTHHTFVLMVMPASYVVMNLTRFSDRNRSRANRLSARNWTTHQHVTC